MPAAAPGCFSGRDAGHFHHIGFLFLSRDRLAMEVKGLTAAPDAAVNGADFTEMKRRARAAGAETHSHDQQERRRRRPSQP
jgi:hypothetical protein